MREKRQVKAVRSKDYVVDGSVLSQVSRIKVS